MYATTNAYQRYRQQGILTANPVELIVMLYDGCIKQIKLGILGVERNDPNAANTGFQKAQNILMELINSLDLSYSMSKDLMDLYEFMIHEINEVNLHKEDGTGNLNDVLEMLGELRQSWGEIAKEGRGAVTLEEG